MKAQSDLKIGDRVEVQDVALAMLRILMPDLPPNNLGKVSRIMKDGQILVEFSLGGENHSQVAPYPRHLVRLLLK